MRTPSSIALAFTKSQIAILAISILTFALLFPIWNNTQAGMNCPPGYVHVPGSSKFTTLPGFCVMKYEARKDTSNDCNNGPCPTSLPLGKPWNFATSGIAKNSCELLGPNYHLISEREWMTIAENIAATPINDIDSASGLQLASGNSSRTRGVLTTTKAADPKINGCDINLPLSHSKNAYAGSSCELRGGTSTNPLDNKGYFDTNQQWSDTGYKAGGTNKSQLRTHVLSNGKVLWDFAGNLWEWTDASPLFEAKTGTGNTFEEDSDSLTGEMPRANRTLNKTEWVEFPDITNFNGIVYTRPSNSAWNSSNGIGQLSLNPGNSWDDVSGNTSPYHSFARGGAYGNIHYGGIFSLDLALGPTYNRDYTGFRCAYSK